ncbi:hypothetical protein BH92_04240 [Rhodococcoides fascians A21d2]|uniref:hypothetical protein n=1 Tax=Rhodococcoides fascians TaxID=1828 RepID=UPI000563EB31|nr:hypothetical protein [Rhodococcus fascians]QIH99176.1 hypothetical protein BH92_04240 [Rhodococcus fascians A21d2]
MTKNEDAHAGKPEAVEEPGIDYLEEPVIDGSEPRTRAEFVRDSKPDSNTVRQPPQPIGEEGSAGLGDESVAERN